MRDAATARGQSAGVVLRIKEQVRERDGYACTKCGLTQADHVARTGRRLDVHRTTPGSLYSLAGCVTICRKCHGSEPKRGPGDVDLAHAHRGRQVCVWVSEEHSARLDAFLASQKFRVPITVVVTAAIEKLLRKEGCWPA